MAHTTSSDVSRANFRNGEIADDEIGLHLGLFDAGQLCSIISLFQNDGLQFRKFATIQTLQRKGYGSFLLSHVFAYAKEKNTTRVWCNARTTAIGLYERFGMHPFGNTWEQHGHRFIKMQIEL